MHYNGSATYNDWAGDGRSAARSRGINLKTPTYNDWVTAWCEAEPETILK